MSRIEAGALLAELDPFSLEDLVEPTLERMAAALADIRSRSSFRAISRRSRSTPS